jgi:hypothetical protein
MWGEEAAFSIRSDIINLKVCGPCAKEARDLHLTAVPLMDVTEHPNSKSERAAA